MSDTLLGGVAVYPACGVSREVKLASAPPRPQYTAPRGTNCARATVRVVIDSGGKPVPTTARVVRTTDPNLSSALLAALPALRYEPAVRDGAPVAQLAEVSWGMAVTVTPAAVRGGTRGIRPNC